MTCNDIGKQHLSFQMTVFPVNIIDIEPESIITSPSGVQLSWDVNKNDSISFVFHPIRVFESGTKVVNAVGGTVDSFGFALGFGKQPVESRLNDIAIGWVMGGMSVSGVQTLDDLEQRVNAIIDKFACAFNNFAKRAMDDPFLYTGVSARASGSFADQLGAVLATFKGNDHVFSVAPSHPETCENQLMFRVIVTNEETKEELLRMTRKTTYPVSLAYIKID